MTALLIVAGLVFLLLSVRALLFKLRAVQDFAYNQMTRTERAKVVVGAAPAPTELTRILQDEPNVLPKQGAPLLEIPAGQTILLRNIGNDDGDYEYEAIQSVPPGIRVHADMFIDHFPPRYEHAFDHLREELVEPK